MGNKESYVGRFLTYYKEKQFWGALRVKLKDVSQSLELILPLVDVSFSVLWMRLDSDSKSDEPPSGFKSVRCCVGEQKVGQALVKKIWVKRGFTSLHLVPRLLKRILIQIHAMKRKTNKQTKTVIGTYIGMFPFQKANLVFYSHLHQWKVKRLLLSL